MTEVPVTPIRGTIHFDLSATLHASCGRCSRTATYLAGTTEVLNARFAEDGWYKSRDYGWICKPCFDTDIR